MPAYQYYEFQPTALYGGNNSIIQLSEFALFNSSGSRVFAASVTNPGGSYGGSEGPSEVNDNNLGTKWCDTAQNGLANDTLILNMGAATAIASYNWATGNDTGPLPAATRPAGTSSAATTATRGPR